LLDLQPRQPRAVGLWLLQLEEAVSPSRLFSDYAYFSSYSDTWMSHAKQFVDSSREKWQLDERSLVVEVASNDGYLLRHFVALGIPVLGIDPAENVVPTALAAGVPTEVGFFGLDLAERLAEQGVRADLVVANMRKDLRRGRVLIDWSQNHVAKTTIAPYSLRARAEPTVSAPVSWEEVERLAGDGKAERLRFLPDDVLRRVEEHGDLFAPLLG
jgi:hypothetical protein